MMFRNEPPMGQPIAPGNQRPEPSMTGNIDPNPAADADYDESLKATNTPISPEADYKPDAGVRSLNKLPAVIAGFVLMVLLGIMLFNINSGDKKQQPQVEQPDVADQTNRRTQPTSDVSQKMFGDQQGVIESRQKEEVQAEPQQPVQQQIIVQQQAPIQQQPQAAPEDQEAAMLRDRIRQMKLASFTAAVTSASGLNNFQADQINLNGTSTRQPVTNADYRAQLAQLQRQANSITPQAAGSTDAMDLYRQRMAQMPGGASMPASSGSFGGLTNDNMSRPGSQHLLQEQPDDNKWTLDSKVHTPTTPFEVLTGTVIPAVLVTGINSDLPGQMIAQVSQNVYDTARGEHLIIPQGTRLIGQYGNSVAYGQERVLVAWNRIVFPDGKSIDIGSMPGATGAGYSGFKDKVNHHYWRLFGSAFLMSMISAGVVYSQDHYADDDDEYGRVTASSAMAEQLANQIGQTAAQLIQRNLSIAPTLEIRPGFRFNVVVTKDLVFSKPYESFDYK